MYQPYVDSAYYIDIYNGTVLNEEDVNKYLKKASRDIDILTYNRIVGKGFDNLTEYQKEVIQEVLCEQADFLKTNEDMITTYLQSYSINGVNMSFGNTWNVMADRGVAIPRELYERLASTGLCCRSFYYG